MNLLEHSDFGYLEKKGKLFTRKFSNIMYYAKFCKNTLHLAKTTTLSSFLSKSYIVMKCSIKLVSGWVIFSAIDI